MRAVAGFGRVIGVDFGLVIPDESKTLAQGAVKPWQTESYSECQRDMVKMAAKYGVALDVPFRDLPEEHRNWVLEGDPTWKSWDSSWPRKWYGVRHFFEWLETKAYKMHIRVLLSRYRSYTECPLPATARDSSPKPCCGALAPHRASVRVRREGEENATATAASPPSPSPLTLTDTPSRSTNSWPCRWTACGPSSTRCNCPHRSTKPPSCCSANSPRGSGFLPMWGSATSPSTASRAPCRAVRCSASTSPRRSALRWNTLFVLDEPSIGLHPRDIGRILGVMTRLRDAGNSLVVVEHDPQLMFAADRLLDIGPGRASGRRDRRLRRPGRSRRHARLAHRRLPVGPQAVDTRRQPRAVDAATPASPCAALPSTTSPASTWRFLSAGWCA